ncbi:MAG: hypothetical protein H6981_00575 [Gammaproteobacteria bacterium]|nr:hypothetical protein [Gammaproteobacteria bacterium]
MKSPIVLIGVGEMGGVFARALLRAGHPVFPITRDMDMAVEAAALPDPDLVLISVAEKDLAAVLTQLPDRWRARAGLLQNELLPRDWLAHGLSEPTVISVWFEKKKGQDAKVLIPSPAFGPKADLLVNALQGIDIAARSVPSASAMRDELVLKNVYILTTNIAGLVVGGTVSELWRDHEALAREVAGEVVQIQAWLTGEQLDSEALIQGMLVAFDGDPDHGCMGRSAPARLARALELADQAGLSVPKLRAIRTAHS